MPFCNAVFYRQYDGGAGVSSHPTILLHGLGGTHLSWPPVIRRIPKHAVIALDLPGHGKSNARTCVDMECHTKTLYQFFHKMQLDRVNLVGHSMGAMVALAFASKYPQMVHKLSLLSIGEILPYSGQLEQNFSHEKTKGQAIDILLKKGFHSSFSPQLCKQLMEPLYQTRLSLLHADAIVGSHFRAQNYMHNLHFPVQMITGKNDALVPLAGVRSLAAGIPHAKLEIIENCGHFLVYEKSDTVKDLLIRFFSTEEYIC